jgi:hypothetical protein
MILHIYISACAYETSCQAIMKQILAHIIQFIFICGLCMQHCKQLSVEMMAKATGNISLIQIKFSGSVLENFTYWKVNKGLQDKKRILHFCI